MSRTLLALLIIFLLSVATYVPALAADTSLGASAARETEIRNFHSMNLPAGMKAELSGLEAERTALNINNDRLTPIAKEKQAESNALRSAMEAGKAGCTNIPMKDIARIQSCTALRDSHRAKISGFNQRTAGLKSELNAHKQRVESFISRYDNFKARVIALTAKPLATTTPVATAPMPLTRPVPIELQRLAASISKIKVPLPEPAEDASTGIRSDTAPVRAIDKNIISLIDGVRSAVLNEAVNAGEDIISTAVQILAPGPLPGTGAREKIRKVGVVLAGDVEALFEKITEDLSETGGLTAEHGQMAEEAQGNVLRNLDGTGWMP
ncbi:MAG: hypothetical protein V3T30_02480 [Thermodesulfobacteriota bacterium]